MRRRPDNGDEMHDGFGSQARGGGSGGGYYSAPTDRIRETNHNIMEMQNNAHIDDLSDQVSCLKEHHELLLRLNHPLPRICEREDRMSVGCSDVKYPAGDQISCWTVSIAD